MTDRPKLFGPDGREIAREQPLLVDAQGRALRGAPQGPPPDRPRLRALELVAMHEGGRDLLVAHDPLGVCENTVVLRLETLPLLQLLDGSRTTEEITKQVVAESGDMRHADVVQRFIDDLDHLYLLESPRFEERRRELAAAYRALPVREPALSGLSYPADADELRKFFGGHYAEARAILEAGGAPAASSATAPRALAVPHLDLRRAGAITALGFLALPDSIPPDLVVLFGTGHSLYARTAALTTKAIRTPFGDLETERALVERVAARVGDAAFEEETAFKTEHSIEFPALHLAYRFGTTPKLVPVLCGSFHQVVDEGLRPADDGFFSGIVEAVRAEAEAAERMGRRVLYLAAVDLSHVGPRFADPEALDGEALEAVRRTDEAALAAAAKGDAEGWYDAVSAHGDSTRMCGFSALYALLAAARPGPGTLLRYEQSLEPGGSVVTCASLAWPAVSSPVPA